MYLQIASQRKGTEVEDEDPSEVAAKRIEAVLDEFVDQSLGARVRLRRTRHLDESRAEIRLGKSMSIVASDSSDDFDCAVDGIIERIESQIRRRTGKRLKKLRRRGKLSHIFTCDTMCEQPGGHHADAF